MNDIKPAVMLTENDVLRILAEYLGRNGYSEIRTASTLERGIDLTARSPEGVTLLVEAKGETSSKEGTKRYGQPFSGNQIWTHVSVALVKTLETMNKRGENCIYGMAFPMSHEKMIDRLKVPLQKLGIVVYLVASTGVKVLN